MTSSLNKALQHTSLAGVLHKNDEPSNPADARQLDKDRLDHLEQDVDRPAQEGTIEYALWYMRPGTFVRFNTDAIGEHLHPDLSPNQQRGEATRHIQRLVDDLNNQLDKDDPRPELVYRMYLTKNGNHIVYWSETPPPDPSL